MKQITALLVISALLHAPEAWPRPVSYPGGWTSVVMNSDARNSLYVHYSPTSRYSLGYKLEYWRDGEYAISALQMNNLLQRFNGSDYQSNIYLKSGVGVAYRDRGQEDHKVEPTVYTGVAIDWESRRFFARYENRYTEAGAIDDFFMQSVRVGIAPYLGDYGDLHTWVMLELEHKPEHYDPVVVKPLLRFFKGTHLVEVGMSTRGEVLFNWIIRY